MWMQKKSIYSWQYSWNRLIYNQNRRVQVDFIHAETICNCIVSKEKDNGSTLLIYHSMSHESVSEMVSKPPQHLFHAAKETNTIVLRGLYRIISEVIEERWNNSKWLQTEPHQMKMVQIVSKSDWNYIFQWISI